MLRHFGFGSQQVNKDHNHHQQQITVPVPSIGKANNKSPPPPQHQVRMSRLGKPYEESIPVVKKTSVDHNKANSQKTVQNIESNPHKVSRLGIAYDDSSSRPSSNYETMESWDNPILSFMLSCVQCEDTKQESQESQVKHDTE